MEERVFIKRRNVFLRQRECYFDRSGEADTRSSETGEGSRAGPEDIKGSNEHFFREKAQIFKFMKNRRHAYSVERMCRSLIVSRCGYYKWLHRTPSKGAVKRAEIVLAIGSIFKESRQTYGSPRMRKAPEKEGFFISKPTTGKYMREAGIRVNYKKKFVVTTDSKHTYPVAANLLDRHFSNWKIGEALVSDLTYIRTNKGWMYYITVIDLYDRKIIGWACSTTMKAMDDYTRTKNGIGQQKNKDRGNLSFR